MRQHDKRYIRQDKGICSDRMSTLLTVFQTVFERKNFLDFF